ncbi:MAG TPA: hypothetical protein ENK43_11605 [Planctomycetes bacterium]|nr:hypothetical protein [Planctomycetota bacterium]
MPGRYHRRTLSLVITTVLTLGVLAPALAAQFPVLEIFAAGAAPSSPYPHQAAFLGDVDGDGVEDVGLGDSESAGGGLLRVISGRTGTVLWYALAAQALDRLGASVVALGDVDGDGLPDLAVGAPQDPLLGQGGTGYVRVYSGGTGLPLGQLQGQNPGDRFGWDLLNLGDCNGDGIPDFAVGAPQTTVLQGPAFGYVQVFSGSDLSLLATLSGQPQDRDFGFALAAPGDLNGDGLPEIAIGAPGGNLGQGILRVISGKTMTELWNLPGAMPLDFLGQSVTIAGDWDQDGFLDVAVGVPGFSGTMLGQGQTLVLSGASGATLITFMGTQTGEAYGRGLSGNGDFNQDGIGDLVIASARPGVSFPGAVDVISGADFAPLLVVTGDDVGASLRSPLALPADAQGDGFAECLARGAQAFFELSVAGRHKYGPQSSLGQTLDLTWAPGPASQPTSGTLVLDGPTPFVVGGLIVSAVPAQLLVSGQTILVDTFPGNWFPVVGITDATGQITWPSVLRQPAVAGASSFLQGFLYDPTLPIGYATSGGLELRFTR